MVSATGTDTRSRRTRGPRDVPVRMVLYPGGSHLFLLDGRPSHREDHFRRPVEWIITYADR
ncbi:hypothetical protein ACFYXM_21670 [Streptomyces sp. NPDC002476]|uniref:hypothetical protein n=1 Tax=Streptomyces sp. NPDC002476 TaxID=3364648 RepID=UPI0036C1F0D5